MKSSIPENNNAAIRSTVKFAMLTGAVAAGSQPAAVAQDVGDQTLEEIIVTGSRIRRVDAETASPVQIITAEAVAESGAQTIGDLLQNLPLVAGTATNPSTNNGGGDGASNVELRGIGVERTLVLLNGRRYAALGDETSAVDVNSLPVNMIERVEILKEGAGAVYGSDAIGGVVNFITRSMDGLEVALDYGVSSRSDGKRKGVALTYGNQSDRGNLTLGLNYNEQRAISAGDRAFSRNAIYFYGSVFEGGSGSPPNGQIYMEGPLEGLRAQYAAASGIADPDDCVSVIRIAGAAGSSLDDYRCYVGSGANNDAYNFQPENLIMTPQKRVSVFTLGDVDINDNIQLYTEFLYNYTNSGFKIAPLPWVARDENVVVSADSMYNPFGNDFGGSVPINSAGDLNPRARWRLTAIGNRGNEIASYQGIINTGVRGQILDSSWNYDVTLGYSRQDQETTTSGYLYSTRLSAALGPSFMGPDGPTCGTPTAVIAGCIPVNIFNLEDPAQAAALGQISAAYDESYKYSTRSVSMGLSGDLATLPAGKLQLAGGFEWRQQESAFDTSFVTEASPPDYLNCLLGQEPCSGDRSGGFIVRELYAEALVPLLSDAPYAQSLNLIIGGRYSDYSTYGTTTNGTYKLEWRPMGDLLVRASYADVFRAPTLLDLYQAPAADAPTFTDPCIGLTQPMVDDNPNLALACVNVPRDGSFDQAVSQITGLRTGNATLDPETGSALTFGFVYDPSWLDGATLSIDFWKYKIDDQIQLIDVNTSAQICVLSGDPTYCGYHQRFPDGSTKVFLEPRNNLGTLKTQGVDISVGYRLSTGVAGTFNFGLDATITDVYDSYSFPGIPKTEVAGYYDRQYGNQAKLRFNPRINWALGDFSALLTGRYIDKIKLSDPDAAPGTQPDLKVKAVTYLDFTAGYKVPRFGTQLRAGVQNLTDKQPPILYQNNVTNANTDVATYDTVGRYFFVNLTQKF